ncbi:hypothetical protein [Clostridium paraputrificum]|uniref:hypothetical protein n=1 Tax=Clostridium paraputrificum TaxID=29363 RepID=UPI000C07D593|nr:hypothetical protein [Clostridium paraputrificum]
MAERRMFAKTIIDSDAFLDMPQSTQLLYFHLSMRADDDGFINNPKSIMRNVKCNDDDLTLLAAKKFIINFGSGIVVIKHWKIHNYIAKDRYKETKYKQEKSMLSLDENNSYTLEENDMYTECIQPVYEMDTQVRLGKDRLGKDNNIISKDIISSTKVQPVIDKWNSLNLQKLVCIKEGTNRYKLLNARIKDYGMDSVLKAIDMIGESSFLKGNNTKGWTITFDWLIKPNNFIKVLEGNYSDKQEKPFTEPKKVQPQYQYLD